MFTSYAPDGYAGFMMLFFGGSMWLLWAVPAVFVEAWLLHVMLATGIWDAFFHSVAANTVSTFVGIVVGVIALTFLQTGGGWQPSGGDANQILIGGAIVLWLASIFIEGWALTTFDKKSRVESIWTAAFTMNCVSYILGFVVVFGKNGYIVDTFKPSLIFILSAIPFTISVIIPTYKWIFDQQPTDQ